MAGKPRRAGARALIEAFPNPHQQALRSRRKAPRTVTECVGAEALDVLEALAACGQPVALMPGATAFLVVLPDGLMDRLAALGAQFEDCEPSLGSHAAGLIDAEEDAGEMPEDDPADWGIADYDGLSLLQDEMAVYGRLAECWAANRRAVARVRAQIRQLPARRQSKLIKGA